MDEIGQELRVDEECKSLLEGRTGERGLTMGFVRGLDLPQLDKLMDSNVSNESYKTP